MLWKFNITTITLVSILYGNIAYGQQETKLIIGAHGAPAGSTVCGDSKQRKEYGFKFKPIQGFIVGVEMQYAVKPKLYLSLEVNYERKGYAQDVDILDQNNNLPIANTTVMINKNYNTIPIIAKFILSDKKIKIFINTGIYAGYFITYSWSLLPVENYKGEKGSGRPNAKFLNLLDFGLVTGLGWDFPIKEHFKFSTEIRNNLGITGTAKGETLLSSKIRNESIALLFGIGYKI